MRNFILILMIGLFTISCERHNGSTEVTHVGNVDYAMHFEYDGHKYIMFRFSKGNAYDEITGFVHDPKCPCHENNNQKIDGLW